MFNIPNIPSVTSSSALSPATSTTSLVDELSEQAIKGEVNLGQLIAKTYLIIEDRANNKSNLKIDELEAHEKKLEIVTQFLSTLETQLAANPNAKEVDMTDKSALIEDLRRAWDHPLLGKSKWSLEEANALKTGITRHSQIYMQQIHHLSSDVSRAIEEGTEFLQIFRKLIEMNDRLHQTFTSNQKTR